VLIEALRFNTYFEGLKINMATNKIGNEVSIPLTILNISHLISDFSFYSGSFLGKFSLTEINSYWLLL
jgi:hypothetical protein